MKNFYKPSHEELKQWLKTHKIAGGVNTLTYTWPNASPQPGQTNETVKCSLVTDGTLTSQTITHNLGFSVAELAAGYPEVVIEPGAAAGHTVDMYVSSKTANTIVVTFLAVVWTAFITIKRANSAIA